MKKLRSQSLNQLFGPTGGSQAVAALHWTIDRLTMRGAAPPTGSRLHQALEILSSGASHGKLKVPGSRQRRLTAEAFRTAQEFWMIASALNGRVDKKLHQKLQRAYGGTLDPASTDDVSARARDIQFELWLASWIARGGKPVELGGADLRVPVSFEWQGIAAKRIRSFKKILSHVKKGAEQVKQHEKSGMIALSIDNYSQLRNRDIKTLQAGERFFQSIPHLPDAIEWLRANAPHIKVVIMFGTVVAWRAGVPPRLQTTALRAVDVLTDDPVEHEKFVDWFNEHSEKFNQSSW